MDNHFYPRSCCEQESWLMLDCICQQFSSKCSISRCTLLLGFFFVHADAMHLTDSLKTAMQDFIYWSIQLSGFWTVSCSNVFKDTLLFSISEQLSQLAKSRKCFACYWCDLIARQIAVRNNAWTCSVRQNLHSGIHWRNIAKPHERSTFYRCQTLTGEIPTTSVSDLKSQ